MTACSGWVFFSFFRLGFGFSFYSSLLVKRVIERGGGARCKKGGYHFSCICRVNLGFHFFINPNIKKQLVVFTVWCMGVSEVILTYPSTWVDCVRDECSTWQPMVEACF